MLTYSEQELRALQAEITDPNFRIFADREGITVLNSERFVRGTNIQEIFEQLDVDDASHAFYLGKELARASLAVTLGKTYRQEGALSWGYLTPADDARAEHVQADRTPEAHTSARTAVIVTELTPAPDPVRCCELLEGLAVPNLSRQRAQGNAGHSLARYSFLTADPVAVVRSKGAATERLDLLTEARTPSPAMHWRPFSQRSLRTGRSLRRDCRRFREAPPGIWPTTGAEPARASAGAAVRRSRDAGCGDRHLRLGDRLGSRPVARVADLDRPAGDVGDGPRRARRSGRRRVLERLARSR